MNFNMKFNNNKYQKFESDFLNTYQIIISFSKIIYINQKYYS